MAETDRCSYLLSYDINITFLWYKYENLRSSKHPLSWIYAVGQRWLQTNSSYVIFIWTYFLSPESGGHKTLKCQNIWIWLGSYTMTWNVCQCFSETKTRLGQLGAKLLKNFEAHSGQVDQPLFQDFKKNWYQRVGYDSYQRLEKTVSNYACGKHNFEAIQSNRSVYFLLW